jgi:hypothetical protein
MKRLVKFIAIAALIACAAQLFYVYVRPGNADAAAASRLLAVAEAPQNAAGKGDASELPLDRSQTVDFSADESSLAELTVREREDQYRDWLLFAAVAAFQTSAEDYTRTFFDLPTTRHGYMRPVGTFEYGETRSRVIGNDKVLGLIPAGRSAAERADLLASIADEQRKNQGAEFKQMIVVEYRLDTEHSRAELTRRADVPYAELFSEKYGYFEKTVAKLADLQQFMATVNDLTLARMTPDGMVLGGRKILGHKYRSIRVEEVATVWQAEQQIHQALAAFEARWKHRTYRTESEKQMLLREYTREAKELKLVKGSGFSLDPMTDYETLKNVFDRYIGLIAPQDAPRIARVSRALGERDSGPFWELVRELDNGGHPQQALMVAELDRRTSFQAARYDGPLQGTEVGMVLFYTDLLAKLWVIDFVDSSPRRGQIRGFVDDPTAPRSLIYQAEGEKLSYARLWFGHSNLGFQVADTELLLARNATRVYSAGSDIRHPGEEAETSAFLAASTDWWNDHYEEVARYEPEYERLNQIMKWSIVIGWLNEHDSGGKLAFLEPVKVNRSNVFPQWVLRHPELRFQQWGDVHFYPAGYKGSTTEALPHLKGPVTQGGVSLATKDVAKRAPLVRTLDKVALRSNLDYAVTTSKDTFKTLEETVFKFKSSGPEQVSVVAEAKAAAKFRGTTGQLAHANVERLIAKHADGIVMETRAGGNALGELKIARSGNGFKIGWHARELDRARSIARNLSTARRPDLALMSDPNIEAVIRLPGDTSYAVKLRGSSSWVQLAPERQPSVDIAKGWQVRAAGDHGEAVRSMQASVIDEAQLGTLVGKQAHVIVESSNQTKPFLRVLPQEAAVGKRLVEVEAGNARAAAWVEPQSEKIHLVARGDGGAGDVIALARRLGADDLGAIRKGAAGDGAKLRLAGGSHNDAGLVHDLENLQFRKAAKEIADDPHRARRIIDEQLNSDLKRNAEIRKSLGPDEGLHDLERLIAVYGKRPELTFRQVVAYIERGNIDAAVESASTKTPRMISDRPAFFDEAVARYSSASNQKADIYRAAEYADLADRMARPAGASELSGSVRPVVADGHFDFEVHLSAMPEGKPVALADLGPRTANAVVYRQKSLSLNQLDSPASVDEALRQVISGGLGKVVRLSQQRGIAHYRPAAIWAPHDVQFVKATKSSQHLHLHTHGHGSHPCDVETETCPTEQSEQQAELQEADVQPEEQAEVYLIIANPDQTADVGAQRGRGNIVR